MKKIFISIALFIGVISNIQANVVSFTNTNNITIETEEIKKDYNFKINHEQLGELLGLSDIDIDSQNKIYRIYDIFCKGMNDAGNLVSDKRRQKMILSSIDYALRNMRGYLDDIQYRKFLKELNINLYKKGFIEEIYAYCEKFCS